jgi:hypothetical protein
MLIFQARGKEVKMHLYEDNHPLGKKQIMFFSFLDSVLFLRHSFSFYLT